MPKQSHTVSTCELGGIKVTYWVKIDVNKMIIILQKLQSKILACWHVNRILCEACDKLKNWDSLRDSSKK